jgi:hypothetical protein
MTPATRLAAVLLLTTGFAYAQPAPAAPELQSVGPIAFGPNHTLFVSDPVAATIYAFDIEHLKGEGVSTSMSIANIDQKIAAMLGTTAQGIRIIDVATNPDTGQIYLAVTRGTGPDATPVLFSVGKGDKIAEVSLDGVEFSSATLPNAPESREGRRGNPRMSSITDMAFVDNLVVVAGLSNEEFSSKLRTLAFPFSGADTGTSVEIYHGAHGRYETNAPVRTFVAYEIDSVPHLLAAYTCTPLVAFPVSDLEPGKKVMGKTIAELGNRNNPLDMIVYQDGDEDVLLLANSSRGVMKVSTKGIADASSITDRVSDTAGINYETIEELQGVMQLDKLDNGHAVILVQSDSGLTLEVIPMP